MKKRYVLLICMFLFAVILSGCGKDEEKNTIEKKPALDSTSYANFDLKNSTLIENYKVALLSGMDEEDQFYTSAKKGLESLSKRLQCEIQYETYDEADDENFNDKVKSLVDSNCKMIWVLGEKAKDINIIAEQYSDVNFAVVDEYYDAIMNNVLVINFNISEEAFLAGYTGASSTSSNKVGILYVNDDLSNEYSYGFKSGVSYAGTDCGKDIVCYEYKIPSDAETADIKNQVEKVKKDGVDVLYVATDTMDQKISDVIKNSKLTIIGSSDDMYVLLPDNTLTYTVELIDSAVELVSFHAMSGDDIAGYSYEYGVAEGAIDIASGTKSEQSVIENQVETVKEIILGGEFSIPNDEDSYKEFVTNTKVE